MTTVAHRTQPPLALRERVDNAGRALAYIVAAVPLTLVAVLLLGAGAVLGLLLLPLAVGVPILTGVIEASWAFAGLERRLANQLLGARIPPMPQRGGHVGFGLQQLRARMGDGFSRVPALLLFKIPVSVLSAVTALGAVALALVLAVLGIGGAFGADDPEYVGPVALGPLSGLLLLLLAVPAAVTAVAVLDGLATALRRFVRALLTPPAATTPGPIREMLAESLGDRSLSVAYWLPEREIFVDEHGTPVDMPEPGSGRTWTSVDRGGRRVAAIVHDAELDTGPELVQAAAAGAALALDNEQLKADLRARLEELRASRVRIVEAGDQARRRLERDLHDGAQQQLVALALDLRLLKRKISGDPETVALVERANHKLAAAIEELRELARGIHPAILTDRGLAPAVGALTRRFPLEVDCELTLDERYPPAVEAAGYFVVTEALANVTKYAQASRVSVRIAREGDEIVVEVADDGVGGADPTRGSGLGGLTDRLAAVDGSLTVNSPPGRGTRVRARIPVGAPSRAAAAAQRDGDSGTPAGRSPEHA